MSHSYNVQRRQLLGTLAAMSWTAAWPSVWAQAAPGVQQGRLVVVFLRGAYDGLSATVPYADADYYRARSAIAIPAPDGSANTALKLDDTFALHPALAPLLPLWREGVLGFIPAAGSPDPTRSHFEAQNHWEIGTPGKSNAPRGWLNALAAMGRSDSQTPIAIGVGESNPKILSGPALVRLIPAGKSAVQEGVLANDTTRQALLDLYATSKGGMGSAFAQGADSRVRSAHELAQEAAMPSDNGAASVSGLVQDAQRLGILMRNDRRLRLGFLSAGGWDSHANQGAVTGAVAKNLEKLAQALVALRKSFSEPGDVVVVVSEFGRTVAENGTRGTDHGHGNTLWVMGDRIQGGRWHGQWTGLAQANLYEGRDLPVHHDFRSVFAQILHATMGLRDTQLQELFPGARMDPALAGLVRSA